MFSYKKILKQALEITLKHKFLWIFGLFLVSGNVMNVVFNFQDEIHLLPKLSPSGSTILFFTVAVLFLIFFRSKGGLVIAVKAILDKQPTSFGKAFRVSQLFFNRIFGVCILIELILFVLAIILIGPIVFMFINHFYYRGIALLILGLIIFLPAVAIGTLANILSPLFIVIYDLTVKEAITKSLDFISAQWVTLIGLGLLLFSIELLGFFVLTPIVFLVKLPYHMGGLVLLFMTTALFLFLQSIVSVFTETAWVLAFLELIKPQKLTDEEIVPIPEIV